MNKPINIKLEKHPNHISPFLTHWTGRNKSPEKAFDIIKAIVTTKKLMMSQCPFGFANEEGKIIGVSMICFTETPIQHSIEHCKKFGYFGIGFDKEEMISIGANPILYIVDARKEYQEKISEFYWHELQNHWDGGVRQIDIPFEFRNSLSWLLASTQPYRDTYEGKFYEYYSQREWRIIRILPGGATRAEIENWGVVENIFDMSSISITKGQGEIKGVIHMVEEIFLEFRKSAIKSIIVPKDYIKMAKELISDNEMPNCDIYSLDI